jgi:hypothetical protein
MGKIGEFDKVKLFVGIMFTRRGALAQVVGELENKFGVVSIKSPSFDFNFTDYYNEEMGYDIKKVFIGFGEPIEPEEIADIKIFTIGLEKTFSKIDGKDLKRTLNIDPGFVDMNNVVLVSTKNRSQRIPLKKGIYGEVTLVFIGKKFEPLPWTYPDFKTPLARKFLSSLREY